MLSIGSLPSADELKRLSERGFYTLVNVSGVSLDELFPADFLSSFKRYEFRFRDAFSDLNLTSAQWQQFQRTDMIEVMRAVERLSELVRLDYAVHIFCHQGLSRSPLVAAAALMNTFQLSAHEAMQEILRKQPRAQFSARSSWYLNWFETTHTQGVH